MASLLSLASIADVEARLGQSISDATLRTKLQSILDDASVVVRNYTRRDFTVTTETVRIKPRGSKATLPQRPVTAVNSVSTVYSFGNTTQVTPLSYWSWVAGSDIWIGDQSLVINGPSLELDDPNVWLEVNYTHGYVTIPDDVITVVANMALRVYTLPGGGLVDLQTVGPYTTRYASFTSAGPLGLSEGDREVLNRYIGQRIGTVDLGSGS